MKTIKEEADELINKHKLIEHSIKGGIGNPYQSDIKHCILDVENTLSVLQKVFENQDGTTDIYIVAGHIMKQTELLTELKSRL